jgi:uncharacterized protein (TIGR03435 family)
MTGDLTNHVWQSTLFAAAAGLLTVAFRKNRAEVRYWLWFSASIKFFVPFSLLVNLGSQLQWAPAAHKFATQISAPAVSFTMGTITQPFPDTTAVQSTQGNLDWMPIAAFGVWLCGFAGVALVRFRAWRRIRAAVRASVPMEIPAAIEVRSSPGLLEPGVVGWRRPILLLPAGIQQRLSPPQLEAVLAHELCHGRRLDNLFAGVHMLAEAAYWFHPLVWWIGARLVDERERACDEEVLSLGSEPRVYAEAILNVCKLYVESPLGCVSGVTGSNLNKRVEAIMTYRIVPGMTFAKKAVLAVAATAALAAPVVVGVMNAPGMRAQSAAPVAAKFDSASIQPCADGIPTDGRKRHPGNMQIVPLPFPVADGAAGGSASSGRLSANCQSLMDLIRSSYVYFGNGQLDLAQSVPIEGGPDWVNSDRYDISASASGSPSQDVMVGPMMQALLATTFKLSVHREVRQAPVYVLKVADGGLKLRLFQEGSCTPVDFIKIREAIERGRYDAKIFEPVGLPGVNYCVNRGTGTGPNNLVEAQGMSLDAFCFVYLRLDRPVLNQTGITGLYDFHLEFASGEAPSNVPAGRSIFTAIQEQLGLKLETATAPREFLVIDHVERPSGN